MNALLDRHCHFIGGRFVPSAEPVIPVYDSTDGTVLGAAPSGSEAEMNEAVLAASNAFPAWAAAAADDRRALLAAIADGLEQRAAELADLLTRETGMPLTLSRPIQVGLAARIFRSASALAVGARTEEVRNSLIVREPVGVVGAITPWNFPLHQIAAKVAFAMAAGCSVVLKPSEVAPLDAYVLAEVVERSGVPGGVFNLVAGSGAVAGRALAAHPMVDMVSFTGSTSAGATVAAVAARTIKRVALELGGKSANLLLDDLDDAAFEAAVRDGVAKCFLNSGQACIALSRMVVPQARRVAAEEILADEVARNFQPCDPFDPASRLGPLASSVQVDRVTELVRGALGEGTRCVTGGPQRPSGLGPGYYVSPTVLSDATNEMRIAQEEVFGPVLTLLTHRGDDDAVAIANASRYGLSGAVWSADPVRAERAARGMRTGQVDINGGRFNGDAPFGGYKQSGVGREYGRFGVEEFLEVKSLQR